MTTMTMYFLLAFLLIVSVRVRRERNIRKDRARQIGSLYDSSARKESEYARARDRMAPFVTDSRLETFSAMFADASLCFKEAVGYLERVVSEDLDAERWGDLVRDAEEWLGLMEDITLRLSGSELIVSGLERKIAETEELFRKVGSSVSKPGTSGRRRADFLAARRKFEALRGNIPHGRIPGPRRFDYLGADASLTIIISSLRSLSAAEAESEPSSSVGTEPDDTR